MQTSSENNKSLVVYFSYSGNTREVAKQIHKDAGGDLVEIVTVDAYPREYNAVVDQAKREIQSEYKPALKTKINNISGYDVIFLGYPNWWSTIPAPVAAFLSEYDFSGKIIAPFCTHGGGGLGRSASVIREICPESDVAEALAVSGNRVAGSAGETSKWLNRILNQDK